MKALNLLDLLLIRIAIWLSAKMRCRRIDRVDEEPAGLVLGESLVSSEWEGEPHPVVLIPKERSRHVWVLGSTGTGKSTVFLRFIDFDVQAGRTICLVDLRGDLLDRVLARLGAMPGLDTSRVHLFDLREETRISTLNPLKGEGQVYGKVLLLLDAIHQQAPSWGVQIEDTMRASLLAMAQCGLPLAAIEKFLTDATFRSSALERVSDESVLTFFRAFDDMSPSHRHTWVSPVLNKLAPLLCTPLLRRVFSDQAPPFELPKLLNQPGQIILIGLAADRLHASARLVGSLVLAIVQTTCLARVDIPEERRVPVSLFVDEFETMATESFSTIIAEGRRVLLQAHLAHQNLTQLPHGLKHVIRNNVATRLFFGLGSLDAAELAPDIVGLGKAEEVRRLLQTLEVGQAVLSRQAQPSQVLKVQMVPDPVNAVASADELRRSVFERQSHHPVIGEVQDEPGPASPERRFRNVKPPRI